MEIFFASFSRSSHTHKTALNFFLKKDDLKFLQANLFWEPKSLKPQVDVLGASKVHH
jgi:hypothetical protein